ncbi:unnamed protein product [Effrenium voratum]|nr:unnamed protein product [Effrenium voratum]
MAFPGLGAVFRCPPVAAVRIRPWLPHEEDQAESICPATPSSSSAAAIEVRSEAKCFTLPAHLVFTGKDPQAGVCQKLLSGVVHEAVEGLGTTIIACGTAGSGKSHSLLGFGSDPGLIPHATLDLFRYAASSDLKVWCSYLEVHHEELIDLLAPLPSPSEARDAPPLEVVEQRGSNAHILGLTECFVQSIEQVQELVAYGNKRRAANAKLLGIHGHSHTVFTFRLSSDLGQGRQGSRHRSQITFVDCASYIGFKDHSLQGLSEALKDLALGGPRAKGLGKAFFRRSALTQLLEDALCGKEQLILLSTVSPGDGPEALEYLRLVQAVMDSSHMTKERNARQGEAPSARLGNRESSMLLRLEIEALQKYIRPGDRPDQEMKLKEERLSALQRVLEEREAKMAPAEEQAAATRQVQEAQRSSLAAWGISVEELTSGACLLRLHSDPMLTASLAYNISPSGSRVLGSGGDILLHGLGVAPEHGQVIERGGSLWLYNLSDRHRLTVNGKIVAEPEPGVETGFIGQLCHEQERYKFGISQQTNETAHRFCKTNLPILRNRFFPPRLRAIFPNQFYHSSTQQ